MITALLLSIIMTADPTHVYEVTWDSACSEKETLASLKAFKVVQVKHEGVASRKKKWLVVIQSNKLKTQVRDDIKNMACVTRVRITY